jgi:hypothetical protein
MDINQVVDVQIEVKSAALARAAFNVPLIAGYHTAWPELVRTFSSIDELVTAGITSAHAIYQQAAALLAQFPRIGRFKVGKLTTGRTVIKRITPTVTTIGTVQKVSFRLPGAAKVSVSTTNGGAETIATIVAALTAAIQASAAAPYLTAVDNTTHVTVTADALGTMFGVSDLGGGLQVRDLTTDPGIVANLDAIWAFDKSWYGLLLDSHGKAEILSAAAWAELHPVMFLPTTGDTDALDVNDTVNVLHALNALGYHRTIPIFRRDPLSYGGAAWMGRMFAKVPGAATWQDKELTGQLKDNLSDSEVAALRAKHGNFYTDVAGLGATFEGWASSGRFADITHGVDDLTAKMGEDLYLWKRSLDKIDYDEDGISAAKGVVRKTLFGFARRPRNFLIESSIDVKAPTLAEVDPTDRSSRLLNQITWTAEGKGAIHKFVVRGTVAA